MRVAIAETNDVQAVRRYLPDNYRVLDLVSDSHVIIIGTDSQGWTLSGYVIPRLLSGLIPCFEVFHREGHEWGIKE